MKHVAYVYTEVNELQKKTYSGHILVKVTLYARSRMQPASFHHRKYKKYSVVYSEHAETKMNPEARQQNLPMP
jgi:hypothetical protein